MIKEEWRIWNERKGVLENGEEDKGREEDKR